MLPNDTSHNQLCHDDNPDWVESTRACAEPNAANAILCRKLGLVEAKPEEPEPPYADLAAKEAARDAKIAAITPDGRMAVYQDEAVKRLADWCSWHIDRAEARDLDSDPLWELYDAIDDLAHTLREGGGHDLEPAIVCFFEGRPLNFDGEPSDFVNACAWVAHYLEDVRDQAELETWRCKAAAKPFAKPGATVRRGTLVWRVCEKAYTSDFQSRELQGSPMRELWHALLCICSHRRFARTGEFEPIQAQLWSAEELVFAPSSPIMERTSDAV